MRSTLWAGVVVCVVGFQSSHAQQISQQTTVGQNQSIVASILSPVSGAPYQAEEVTRSVQKLGDGTTITHEWSGTIARDGDGRVREDMYIVRAAQMDGRQLDHTLQSATIGDPVSHSMLFWTGEHLKTAMRMQFPVLPKTILGGIAAGGPPPTAPAGVKMLKEDAAPRPVRLGQVSTSQVKTEELGQQSIEGVLVSGKRRTTTIPTGDIGNDRPIVIVHEEWRSPELKILIRSTDSDPRTGVQTMELHNLVRTEPDAALFQPPAGYKIQDMGDMLKAFGNLGRTASPASPSSPPQ